MQSLSPSMSPSLRVSTGSGPDFASKDPIKLACVIREYGRPTQGQGCQVWGGCMWEGEGVGYGGQSMREKGIESHLTMVSDFRR